MDNQDVILYEVKGRMAIITINRPEKAHAFNVNMLKTMHGRLIEADQHEILAPEFLAELNSYGRIYMYRLRPDYEIKLPGSGIWFYLQETVYWKLPFCISSILPNPTDNTCSLAKLKFKEMYYG